MTAQYEHAAKVVDQLQALGFDGALNGDETDRFLSVSVGKRKFTLPPFAAYNHDASDTANDIAKALA